MSEQTITNGVLNAYVDGELSRSQAAGVARAAARSPVVAARIATLREMKAALAEMAPRGDISLPEMPADRGWTSRTTGLAVAAAIVICLFAGLIYALVPAGPSDREVAGLLQAHHEDWAFERAGDAQGVLPAGVARGAWPPDLGSAQLSFAGVERVSLSGVSLLRLGYEGNRGCKLSLYVLEGARMPRVAELLSSLHVRNWTIDQHGFVLMADGMPRRRFDEIAAALESSLRAGRPFDVLTRQRLARARLASPPCRV